MERVLTGLLLLVSTHCLLVEAQADGISFSLKGESYSHNDLVNMKDIGAGDNGLIAATTHRPCCTSGDWFLPGVSTALSSEVAESFYQSRSGNGELVLNRGDFVPTTTGLFRVSIPNTSGDLTDVYIGLYTDTGGEPTVTSLTYDAPTLTLTCLSSEGPATTVVWRRNCSPLTIGTPSQSVTDSIAGAYTSTLTLPTPVEDGVYSCTVENRRGRSRRTVTVGDDVAFDVTITPSEATPIAGRPLTLTCSHNSGDDPTSVSFQWLDTQGTSVSDTATLTFDMLRESQREYYCVVTVGTEVGCGEYYSNVQVPVFGVDIADVSGTVGMATTLSCTLSGPSVTMAMYHFFKGGVSVGTSSTYIIPMALLSDAGNDYTCQVVISLEYLDLSSPLTLSSDQATMSLTIPDPNVAISVTPSTEPPHPPNFIPYTSGDATISCTTTTFNTPGVDATIKILRVENSGGESEVVSTVRITAGPVKEIAADFVFQRFYSYSPASRIADSGNYVCEGTITPEDTGLSAFITDGTSRSTMTAVDIVDPILDIAVTMVTGRILDIPPYNTYTLTCTASSRVQSTPTTITKTIEWSVSFNNGAVTTVTEGVMTNDLAMATSSSVLSITTSVSGEYEYRCGSQLELVGVADSVEEAGTSSVTVYGPSPPTMPTSLTVLSVNHESAIFQWTVMTVAYDNESYIVMYGLDSNDLINSSATLPGSSDISLTNTVYSVSVGGLQVKTRYYYRVVSTNSAGSTQSELATFNTTGVGPSAPLSLSYMMTTPTNHTFSWLPPNDTDIAVNQYTLTCQGTLRIGDSLDTIVIVTVMTSVTSDLVPWANYTCFVVASNNDGSSPNSNEISFTTPETAPSGPPGNFLAGLPTRGMIPFTWTPLPPNQRNGFIIAYSLECNASLADTVVMVFPPSPSNQYTALSYSALTAYTCSVRARNSKGEGPPATLDVTTGEDVPGAPPMSFTATARTDGTVLFNWSPPPLAQQNGVLTDYTLTCTPPFSFNYGPSEVGGTGEGFSPATRYTCTLAASTAIGDGPSASVTIVTFPSVPTVSVITLSSTQLRVNWTTPLNALITEHIIYLDGAEFGRSQGSEFIMSGLRPYTEYSVGVSASNDAGEGSVSEGQTVRTLEDLPGRVECAPRWMTSSSTSVTVRWAPPTQENGITLAYHIRLVRYGSSDSAPLAEANVTSSDREVTLTPSDVLVEGVPYTVQVVAENIIGRGTEVCQSIDFIAQLEPPPPSGLGVSRTADTLTLSWDIPTLLEARGYVSYTVTFGPSVGSRRRRQTPDECSVSPCNVPVERGGVVISDLDPGTNYDLTVTPSNENGITGVAATATAPSVSSSPVSIGLIAGAAGGGVAIIIILIILIIIVCCCMRMKSNKRGFRPESVALDDMLPEESRYTANPTSSSSSGTTSPRREFTSPLHMSVKDFLEPVELEDFSEFVDHMHQNRKKGFERAFLSLPSSKLQSSAVAERMSKKNRFQNIHPYDDTRVKLQLIPGEPDSHYINASFIDGYNKPGLYIAAQGPLPHTVDDFWRMIWEYKLEHIVMLTRCKEGGKTKCSQYWPSEVNGEYITPSNSLSIVCHEHTPYADYEIRKFFITDLSKPDDPGLVVNHYLFTSWPDHGVPEYATALIGFIKRVRARFNPEKAPLLVHCSAGVGRTGTFIVMDTMLERIKEQSSVNVYQTLQDIRLKRAKMVQTQDQFVFIHDALNDLIRCGDTEIPSIDIRTRVGGLHKIRAGGDHISEFNYQFQLLNQVSPTGQPLNEALQHYNIHKNRYQDKVPNSNSCVYLSHTEIAGGEYINASFINGYKHPKAYIATQAPLDTTVEDFWRMIWEFQSRAIVMLCDIEEEKEEKSYQWWPREVDKSVSVSSLLVTLVSQEQLAEGLVRWNLTVAGEKGGSPGHTKLSISLFHYTDWSENDRPLNTEATLKMVDEVNRVQRSTNNKPITVMCNDGMGRTGAFICIHAQLERLKTEGVMDVFQFAKSARFHRSSLIIEMEHYIFCHDVLADYVDTLSEVSGYSNF